MNKKDQKFFDDHWKVWVTHNPPPDNWLGTKKEWACEEMPCRGVLGMLFFELDRWITRKKSR